MIVGLTLMASILMLRGGSGEENRPWANTSSLGRVGLISVNMGLVLMLAGVLIPILVLVVTGAAGLAIGGLLSYLGRLRPGGTEGDSI
jgi:hypothetical protein